MKEQLAIAALAFTIGIGISTVEAQSYEAQRLLLDTEKLTQLKSILSNMQESYDILTKGYEAVKDISQGTSTSTRCSWMGY